MSILLYKKVEFSQKININRASNSLVTKIMTGLYIWIGIFLLIWAIYNYFLYVFSQKITSLEYNILHIFQKRLNLVPSLYDTSKSYISKHHEVFEEILKLKKQQLYTENDFETSLKLQWYIHHELNFIFTVINKNVPIQKNGKYLLLKDLFIENSAEIGRKMILHKKISQKFNFFLSLKNFTLIGIFVRIEEK